MPYVIGIDPGSPLYMALINHQGQWVAHAGAQVTSDPAKIGVRNSATKCAAIINAWKIAAKRDRENIVAVIELVNPMPGEGLLSATKFVGSMYMMEGVLAAYDIPFMHVRPQEWKSALKLSRDKDASRKLAKELFASRSWRLKHKKDHNYAEAALIAHYHSLKVNRPWPIPQK